MALSYGSPGIFVRRKTANRVSFHAAAETAPPSYTLARLVQGLLRAGAVLRPLNLGKCLARNGRHVRASRQTCHLPQPAHPKQKSPALQLSAPGSLPWGRNVHGGSVRLG